MEQSYMGEKLEKSRFRSKIKVVLLYMHQCMLGRKTAGIRTSSEYENRVYAKRNNFV